MFEDAEPSIDDAYARLVCISFGSDCVETLH